jgi:predicted PurR-regulated permease PerM
VSARAYRVLFWVGAIALVLVLFSLLEGILMPFAASFVIAYLLGPLVDRLAARGVRRSLASLAVLFVFLFAGSVVLVLLVPLVEGQIVRLIGRLPSLVAVLQGEFGKWMEVLQKHLPQPEIAKLRDIVGSWMGGVVGWIAGLFQRMITGGFAILNILSLVVVTPVVAFFLLRDWPRIIAQIDSLVPRNALQTVREQARIIDDTLAGFVHGQAVVCLILASFYAAALSVAGLESALVLGLLIGVLAIVPVVGVAIGFALSVALAALQFGTWTAVFVVVGIFLFGQAVEANILTPKLVGDRIHLHPVWVIFALLAGGQLFGFTGVLISVPAAAVIGVLVRFALERYRGSVLYDPRSGEKGSETVRRIAPFE